MALVKGKFGGSPKGYSVYCNMASKGGSSRKKKTGKSHGRGKGKMRY